VKNISDNVDLHTERGSVMQQNFKVYFSVV